MAAASAVHTFTQVPETFDSQYWKDLRSHFPKHKEIWRNLRKRFYRLQRLFQRRGISDPFKEPAYQELETELGNEIQDAHLDDLADIEFDEDIDEFDATEEAEEVEFDVTEEPELGIDNTAEEIDLAELDAIPEEGIPYESAVDFGAAEGGFETPLLGEGAAAAAAAGEVGAATPAVIGTLGTAVGVGAGVYAYTNTKGATVPGTNNIGPGNEIQEGTSGADEDAAVHDQLYAHIQSGDIPVEELPDVDQHTINQFGDHFAENPLDIPAGLGYLGLQAKKHTEQHTGLLYPNPDTGELSSISKCLNKGVNLIKMFGRINMRIGFI